MIIFENEFPVAATTGKIGREVDLDLAASLFHLVRAWELQGDQLWRQAMPVDC